jgi:hypothetical protein
MPFGFDGMLIEPFFLINDGLDLYTLIGRVCWRQATQHLFYKLKPSQ